MNALPPRRFAPDDAPALARLESACGAHPYLVAARLQVERRSQAETQLKALKRALGVTPVRLPFVFADPETAAALAELSAELATATGLAA